MNQLLVADKSGRIVPRPPTTYKRSSGAPKPITGDAFGVWAGRDVQYLSMPGGATMAFDLSRLTLSDFRGMREHYQLHASLSVLSFILHQIDWSIECDDVEIKDQIEMNIRDIWTQLVRTISQSFWAGYGPGVLDYDNDPDSGYIIITKVKDLVPEESRVHWKKVEGYAPGPIKPMFASFDGIDQFAYGSSRDGTAAGWISGQQRTIPPENSLWYPIFMENGDYYGKKLLRPAFQPWFFSTLIHLFANRYFERFGEPTPLGRYPDGESDSGAGVMKNNRDVMLDLLSNLRNRGVVSLPSDRERTGTTTSGDYEWDIKYLESQMRGADFERYLDRLDEEMSLAVFTPVLLFRTADVGSYNLGQMHLQVFMWMLNSLAGDMKMYIQNYVVDRLRLYNWGPKAPKATWTYRKLGKDESTILQQVVAELIRAGRAMPDLGELGTAVGLTMNEIEQVVEPPADPTAPADPTKPKPKPTKDDPAPTVIASLPRAARDALENAVKRARQQVAKGTSGPITLGYRQNFIRAFGQVPKDVATELADRVYDRVNRWLLDVEGVYPASHAESFSETLNNVVATVVDEALAA